ncbi:N-acetylglucosamine-6-phosphate deacetylase [Microbacterium sp. NPDC055683]
MGLLLHSAMLVTDGRAVRDGWLRAEHGRIVASGDGEGWRAAAQAGDVVHDLRELAGDGAVLSPGLVDLHVHGGAGAAVDDGATAIRTTRALHRAHGTTSAVVSLVTASIDALVERVGAVARLTREDAGVLGSHLEGPFLDPGHHGAHDPALLVAPSEDAVARVLDAGLVDGRQTIRQVTIAPELPGAMAAIRRLTESGIVAAIGHTDADAATTRQAVEAGATLLTHTFNAMPGIHHRAPGPVPVAIDDDRVVLELIADGVHVADEVMRMLLRSAPGRIALVTDAMAATGMADGDFRLGDLDVVVTDGVARVAGTDTIAGSTLTQDAAVRRIAGLGVPRAEALRAATSTPAGVLGMAGEIGTLRVAARADLVLWTSGLEIARVWTAGDE